MQASNLQQEANLISRMERMPLNKALLTLVGLLSWCWVMEAFDLGMIGQVVAVLKKYGTSTPARSACSVPVPRRGSS